MEKTFTLTQLEAIEPGRCGKYQGLVARLVNTARDALLAMEDARNELSEHKRQFDHLEIARPDTERLVLMIHSDGYVQVFGRKWHSVKSVHVPRVSQRNEGLAEDLIVDKLPVPYRRVITSGGIRATGHVRSCPSLSALKLVRLQNALIDAAAKLEAK